MTPDSDDRFGSGGPPHGWRLRFRWVPLRRGLALRRRLSWLTAGRLSVALLVLIVIIQAFGLNRIENLTIANRHLGLANRQSLVQNTEDLDNGVQSLRILREATSKEAKANSAAQQLAAITQLSCTSKKDLQTLYDGLAARDGAPPGAVKIMTPECETFLAAQQAPR